MIRPRRAGRRNNRSRQILMTRQFRFESLEARRVLATFFVDTAVDQLPSPGDVCAADDAAGNNNCTLRLAVQTAESNAGGDEIQIPDGTYLIDSLIGSFDLQNSQDTTFIGNVNDAAAVVIDGNDASRVFDLFGSDNPYVVKFEGLTIRGGVAFDGSGGGGINASDQTSVVLSDVIVEDNSAGDIFGPLASGAGINTTGNLTIDNSIIRNNFAALNGGGISFVTGSVPNTLNISNSTIEGNQAGDSQADRGFGGGIFVSSFDQSAVVLMDTVTISGNTAGDSGGGVATFGAAATIDNSSFVGNDALGSESGGGGLYLIGSGPGGPSFTINGGRFESNSAVAGAGGFESVDAPGTVDGTQFELNIVTGMATGFAFDEGGGALVAISQDAANAPAVIIRNALINNNSAPAAGGLAAVDANLTITNSIISNNTATQAGGAAGGLGAVSSTGDNPLTVLGSSIIGNTANGDAGGIGLADVDLMITDSTIDSNQALQDGRAGGIGMIGQNRTPVLTANRVTISNNQADGVGGGLGMIAGSLQLTNVTVSDNSSINSLTTGGGIFADLAADSLIDSSTIATNISFGSGFNLNQQGVGILNLRGVLFAEGDGVATGINSLGNNLDQSGTLGLNGSGDQSGLDPLLGPLQDNGGPVFTRGLFDGSPAIDAGGLQFPPTDARGITRPQDGDGDSVAVADIGAFELELVSPEVDLVITKSDSVDPVTAGTPLTYTIVVTNNGPDDATGVTIDDTLPAELTFIAGDVDGDSAAVSEANGVVTASVGILAAGGSATLTITGSVASNARLTLNNTATVSSNENDLDPGDNTVSETTATTAIVDLEVFKSANVETVAPGGSLIYTIIVANNGPSDASVVLLEDQLPAELTFVSGDVDGDSGAVEEASGFITANIGDLAAGASSTISLTASVATTATQTIDNTATVSSNEVDSDVGNNSATETTSVSAVLVDLATTIADDVDPLMPGQTVIFSVDVSNQGSEIASDVTSTTTLPADFTIVSADSSPLGTVTVAGNTVTSNLVALDPGITTTVTIVATAGGTAGTFTTNTSVVSTEADADPSNNSASETTTIAVSTSVTGHVYCDINANDSEDPGEAVVGTTVFLDEDSDRALDPAERSTLTDDNGDYTFNNVTDTFPTVVVQVPFDCDTIPRNPGIVRTSFDVGDLARDIAGADVDGDGDLDVLVASDLSNSLTILNNDEGELSLGEKIILSDRPQSIFAFQPAGQSVPLIAVAGIGTPSTAGFVVTLDGTTNQSEITAGNGPIDVVVADFDGNGTPDVLTAAFRSSDLNLALNGSTESVPIASGRQVRAVSAGDINGDGNSDAIYANFGYPGDESSLLVTLLGDGAGGFGEPIETQLNPRLVAVKIVDLLEDPDSAAPAALALSEAGQLSVLTMNGTVSVINSLDVGDGASVFDVGDFNHDGRTDLAVANLGDQLVDLFVGDGTGQFAHMTTITNVTAPSALVVGDFDGDTLDDIVVANFYQDLNLGQPQAPEFRLSSTVTLIRLDVAETALVATGGLVRAPVLELPSANPELRLDVSGDGKVSSLDALQVLNGLAETAAAGEQIGIEDSTDVNGDGRTSALDALLIINYLAEVHEASLAAVVDWINDDDNDDEDHIIALDIVLTNSLV